MIIVGSYGNIQTFGKQVFLSIFQRRYKRMTVTVFLSEYNSLINPGLYILVEMGVGKTKEQTVCP